MNNFWKRRWRVAGIVTGLLLAAALSMRAAGWALDSNWWSEHLADLIGHFLTIAGLIVGVLLVRHQMAQQHTSSLNVQRDGKREELKLRIYEAITDKARRVIETSLDVTSFARMMPINLNSYLRQTEQGIAPSPIDKRAIVLLELNSIAGRAVSQLIMEIEKWEMAIERFDIFRFALVSASRDVQDAFHIMFSQAVPLLPDRRSG